jgi:hypothetical protein
MLENDSDLEKIVLTRLMQLNASIVGLILGLCFGLGLFIATNILVIRGGEIVGPHLSLLGQFFIGYRVTFLGSLIGLVYGFATGFVLGYVFAHLYNWIANFRDRKR